MPDVFFPPENLALQHLFFIFFLDICTNDCVRWSEVFFGRRSLKFHCQSNVRVKFLKYFRSLLEVSLLQGDLQFREK